MPHSIYTVHIFWKAILCDLIRMDNYNAVKQQKIGKDDTRS